MKRGAADKLRRNPAEKLRFGAFGVRWRPIICFREGNRLLFTSHSFAVSYRLKSAFEEVSAPKTAF